MLALVLEAAGPLQPEVLGVFEGAIVLDGMGIGFVGEAVGEREPDAVAGVDGEVGDSLEVFAVNLERGAEDGEVGTGNGTDAILCGRDPGHGTAEVEAQRQLHAHGDGAAHALDDADDVGVAAADGHEIDEANLRVGGGERGFEDQGVVAIGAAGLPLAFHWRDLPVAVFLGAEQGAEAGIGAEVGPAEPVDGAEVIDERSRLAVADEGIVFDP